MPPAKELSIPLADIIQSSSSDPFRQHPTPDRIQGMLELANSHGEQLHTLIVDQKTTYPPHGISPSETLLILLGKTLIQNPQNTPARIQTCWINFRTDSSMYAAIQELMPSKSLVPNPTIYPGKSIQIAQGDSQQTQNYLHYLAYEWAQPQNARSRGHHLALFLANYELCTNTENLRYIRRILTSQRDSKISVIMTANQVPNPNFDLDMDQQIHLNHPLDQAHDFYKKDYRTDGYQHQHITFNPDFKPEPNY